MSEIVHGLGGYNNRGCKCPVCREAHRDYYARHRRMVREAAKPLPPRPDDGDRFVVRSVTGFLINPESSQSTDPATLWYVNDSLDNYRIVYTPPDSQGSIRARGLCERQAERLEKLHLTSLEEPAA